MNVNQTDATRRMCLPLLLLNSGIGTNSVCNAEKSFLRTNISNFNDLIITCINYTDP